MALGYTAIVAGGFFPENGVSTLTNITTRSYQRRKIAQALDAKGTLELRARMTALNGAAPGATATKTLTRVEAAVELGGVRNVETETLINRATTTADRDHINDTINSMSTKTTFGANPPANLDGNPLGTR